jgi:hypothetical protein
MRDRDVRLALHRTVLREHHGDPDTLVVDELGLRHGLCRIDIAVVNGYLHGFEIKSDSDTLERLPDQIRTYSAVLDRATLVVGERHLQKAKGLLPAWWGIKLVTVGPRGGIEFKQHRMFQTNPSINRTALAELLWRPEVIEILRERGVAPAMLRHPRAALYQSLIESTTLPELRVLVRERLKSRVGWRDHSPPL